MTGEIVMPDSNDLSSIPGTYEHEQKKAEADETREINRLSVGATAARENVKIGETRKFKEALASMDLDQLIKEKTAELTEASNEDFETMDNYIFRLNKYATKKAPAEMDDFKALFDKTIQFFNDKNFGNRQEFFEKKLRSAKDYMNQ